jgi:TRAP-type C4-dicarboxylate transport system permease small subunit
MRQWLRLFTLLLAIVFTGFMVYGAIKLVSISLMFGTRSTSWLRTPVAWPQMTIVIGAILMFLQLIVEIIKQTTKLSAREKEGE